ncbi:uncharacterized protein EAE97_000653 [Botrytis byssoidea]|uniref:Paf1 complex protein n=1 Tax=Botrytis byssoidea TaxID=139641 RepID=A0A9P5M9V7_9HELO|nr:uncharacterized protein EAE97_000653 [Botrytis byssoidea]KAF7955394.1 hypothetical protein EAE97_000653 [Botrytis byssoidea]
MASSAFSASRIVHQEYIARIRYSNALPPPPNPPKLLDIPNTGLASGQYTTPGFATRLARDQPLNIEADAELGMPLDLVGMPGIFDGDESSIQAPLHPPQLHPHDRALLRPLATLGKPKFSDTGVSFLRRTEYISSGFTSKARMEGTTSAKALVDTRKPKPIQNLPADRESPAYIKAQVEKGFETAATNLKDRTRVRHPTKRNVQLVDAVPLIPDLDAFPDAGGYVLLKFLTNPVPPSSTYDARVESSVLRPADPTEAEIEMKEAARQAYELDPHNNPAPDEKIQYEMFMPDTVTDAKNIKRKFDVLDPEHDDRDLYSQFDEETGKGAFRLKRLRAYETVQTSGGTDDKYDEYVVIAMHDGTDGLHQKAAHYYPVVQRSSIRPQRTKNIQKMRHNISGEEEEVLDMVDLSIVDPSAETKQVMEGFKTWPYGENHEDDAEREAAEVEEALSEADAEGEDDDLNSPVRPSLGGKTIASRVQSDEDDDDDNESLHSED